jgi:hypothetical protein
VEIIICRIGAREKTPCAQFFSIAGRSARNSSRRHAPRNVHSINWKDGATLSAQRAEGWVRTGFLVEERCLSMK